jgi:hypothetical protein
MLTALCMEHLPNNAVSWAQDLKRLRVSKNFNKHSGNLLCHGSEPKYLAVALSLYLTFQTVKYVSNAEVCGVSNYIIFRNRSYVSLLLSLLSRMSTHTAEYRMFLRPSRDRWSTKGAERGFSHRCSMYLMYRVRLLSLNVLYSYSLIRHRHYVDTDTVNQSTTKSTCGVLTSTVDLQLTGRWLSGSAWLFG